MGLDQRRIHNGDDGNGHTKRAERLVELELDGVGIEHAQLLGRQAHALKDPGRGLAKRQEPGKAEEYSLGSQRTAVMKRGITS